MKQTLTLTIITCILIINTAFAQIQIGSRVSSPNPGKISREEFAEFKKTTTLFILQQKDYANKAAFEKAIGKVWTVTPFKVVTPEEAKNSDEKASSYFLFGGFVVAVQGRSTLTYHTHLSYDLVLLKKDKKDNYKHQLFAKFLIHPDYATYEKTRELTPYILLGFLGKKVSDAFSNRILTFVSEEANISNWSPALLAGYLKTINDNLGVEETRGIFQEYENTTALKTLQKDTLYIPNYVNTKYNAFTREETEKDQDDDDIKSAYPFPYKFVTVEELDKLVVSRPNGVKYLAYIRSSTDKFVSVFDSKTGEMLYTNYTPISYNFKNKDLKKLAKLVR